MSPPPPRTFFNPLPRVFLLLFTILIFSSCDPLEQIVITNRTHSDATVTFVFNEGDNPYKFSEGSDTLVLKLDTTEANAVRSYGFGIGHWEVPGAFDGLVAAIYLIEIETSKVKETYEGEAQIREFLKTRISRKHKSLIEILLE